MSLRRLAVIGSGNVRTSPHVLATLATYFPDEQMEVRLFDPNEERLDLLDRLGRTCFETTRTETVMISTREFDEAMEGASEVLLTLHKDCARRMVAGSEAPPVFEKQESDRFEWRFGDRNKPTPVENLSEHTRTIISIPAQSSLTDEEAFGEAIRQTWEAGKETARFLALMPNSDSIPAAIPTLDWPGDMTQDQETVMAYQILRWVQGDDKIQDLIDQAGQSPFRDWLLAAE